MAKRFLLNIVVALLLCTFPSQAQAPIVEIPFETIPPDVRVVGDPIELQGDVVAAGEVESMVGYRFPDGTLQSTAALGGDAGSACQAVTANAGIYSNRIADFIPPESYVEVCFKGGVVSSDIHTVSESPAGGACVPGDIGWIMERLERPVQADWATAKAVCLMAGMRLPEYFEWQYTCDNFDILGVSNMDDDWEWASNTASFFHPEVSQGIAAPVMGNGGCNRGTWGWVGRNTGARSVNTYRCVR